MPGPMEQEMPSENNSLCKCREEREIFLSQDDNSSSVVHEELVKGNG